MLPKIELHLHLEGAAPPRFIAGLAAEKRLDIGGIFDSAGHYKYADFWAFIRVYEAACTALQTPRDFYRLTRAVLEQSAANGVVYTESFLSPDFCGGRDLAAWRDYLAAIEEAARDAQRDFGIEMRGIITCIRHFGPEVAKETLRCAVETAGDFITGFGIAGDEKQGKLADFAYHFDGAREAGLRLTAHACEWNGPDEVRDALRHLKVERIGHGVRAAADLALVDELAARGVHLEVCPGSNVALGIYRRFKDHPIDLLRKRGVSVSINTDDPPYFHTTMEREYAQLAQAFGWEVSDFGEIARASLDAAFCGRDTKDRIAKLLEAGHA